MAILACQAGKDVYVEKPLCQTIHEGQLIRDAARKHNRVVQVGTQRRATSGRRNSYAVDPSERILCLG
jgi:predicted dehydrogenase